MTWRQKLSLSKKGAVIKSRYFKLIGYDKFILDVPKNTGYLETAKLWMAYKYGKA